MGTYIECINLTRNTRINIYLYYAFAVKTSDSLGNHLNALLQDAETRVYDLSGGGTGTSGPAAGGVGSGSGSGATTTDDANAMQLPPFSTRASFSSIIGEYI